MGGKEQTKALSDIRTYWDPLFCGNNDTVAANFDGDKKRTKPL